MEFKLLRVIAKPLHILYVCDDPTEVLNTRKSLFDSKILHKINVVVDELQVGRLLADPEGFQELKPDLIFVDSVIISNNVMDSLDTDVPIAVVVNHVTDFRHDKVRFYIKKPIDLKTFWNLIQSVDNAYMCCVEMEDVR